MVCKIGLASPPISLWGEFSSCTVSEFADEHRVLTEKESSEPGPWRTDRTPYLRDIQDAIGDESVDEVVLLKPAQVGGSEATRNGLLYWICCAPGPCLVVFPDEQSARKVSYERLRPLIEGTPALRRLATDVQLLTIRTIPMDVYLGWSGSPASLAARPCRYVILDEVDKYPAFSGRDADPIALARARTRTYKGRRKVVILSTPTTKKGHAWRAWERCGLRLQYHVPCPECGELQPLHWSQVKWGERPDGVERVEWAEEIEGSGAAWYECRACKARWDSVSLRKSARHGSYLADPELGDSDPGSRRVGFRFNVLCTPWADLPSLVGKWLRIQGDPAALMEFVNQELGEPWEDRVSRLPEGRLQKKSEAGHPRRVVPAWAGSLVAGVDTQKGHFFWVLRAYGRSGKSRLIDHGRAESFGDLDQLLSSQWSVEGCRRLTLGIDVLGIDSGGAAGAASTPDGSRTDEVYRWSQTDPRIRALKGHGGYRRASKPIRPSKIKYEAPTGARYSVQLYVIDPDHYKDLIAHRIELEEDAESAWQVHSEIDEDYIRQMTAEQKIVVRKGREIRMTWVPVARGSANHFLDCEVQASAVADMIGAHLCPDEKALVKQRNQLEKNLRESKSRRRNDQPHDWARPWARRGEAW